MRAPYFDRMSTSQPVPSRAVLGPPQGDRTTSTTNSDREGAADCRALSVCRSSYTHVSSHIRDRHSSIGIDWPVWMGQK